MKVQGKYIKKPNKPLEDYEKKVKAWRLIGKPLTFTKVLHGARMERRRVSFEKNSIWKPGDAQKGTKRRQRHALYTAAASNRYRWR